MADQICIFNPWTNERDPIGGHMRDWKKAEEKAVELSKANPEWIVIVESGERYGNSGHGYLNGVRLNNPRFASGPTELNTECNARSAHAKDGETFGLPRYFVEQHNGNVWKPRNDYGARGDRQRMFVTEFAARQYIRKETGYRHATYRHMRVVQNEAPILYAISGMIQEGDPAEIGARIDAEMQAQREREAARQEKANAALVQKSDLRSVDYCSRVTIREVPDYSVVEKSDAEILARLSETATDLHRMITWLEDLACERPGHDALTSALCSASEAAKVLVNTLTEGEAQP